MSRYALCALAFLWLAARPAAADEFMMCPAGTPSHDTDNLCYEACKPGYVGVGPVCHRKAPLRDGSCEADEEKDGALCYPKCKDGYTGVGPVCWQDCADGFRDDGAFCAKPGAYGRGAGYPWKFGDPIDSLKPAKKRCQKAHDQGCEKEGAIYYPKCKKGYSAVGCCTCSPKCEDGMTDIGVSCAKKSYGRGAGHDPESYGRGGGAHLRSCTSTDLRRSLPMASAAPFTMIVASDPQLPWYAEANGRKLPLGTCRDEKCTYQNAFKTNERQLAAINDAAKLMWAAPAKPIAAPRGVIINGDLTAYGHFEEWDWFTWYWVDRLRWPAYYGLGNHDYDNNVGQCKDVSTDKNTCAKRSIEWMRATVRCGQTKRFPAAEVTSYDHASMAYAWDIGSYHFVQLQNHPLYPKKQTDDGQVTVDAPGISQSFAWLKEDVARATAAHKHIILNMHDFGDHMPEDNDDFHDAIAGSNVVAIFSGHMHEDAGAGGDLCIGGRVISRFRSGSASYLKFLVAEFGATEIRVAVVDAKQGLQPLVLNKTVSLTPDTCVEPAIAPR